MTLFYKCTLVVCFPTEIPKDEALALIGDIRKTARKAGMTFFFKKEPLEEYLQEAELLVLGKLTEAERKHPLQNIDQKAAG